MQKYNGNLISELNVYRVKINQRALLKVTV